MGSCGVVDSAAWVIIVRMLTVKMSPYLEMDVMYAVMEDTRGLGGRTSIIPNPLSAVIEDHALSDYRLFRFPTFRIPRVHIIHPVPPPQPFRPRSFDASRTNPPSPRVASQHHWGCYSSNISVSAKLHYLVKPRPFVYCVCAVVSPHCPWGFLEDSFPRGKNIIRSRTCGRVPDECCEGR